MQRQLVAITDMTVPPFKTPIINADIIASATTPTGLNVPESHAPTASTDQPKRIAPESVETM